MRLELSVEAPGAPDDLHALLARVGDCCMAVEGIDGLSVSGRIVDDEEIRRLNREFRGIDRATDVLSFPSIAYPKGKTAKDVPKRLRREDGFLGDFAISIEHAIAQAREYGHSPARELGYLAAHSMFHLMGYDHMTDDDRRTMRAMEEKAMALAELPRGEDV